MRSISKEELKEILARHRKWLNSEDGGDRADLSYADLSYANLSYADLRYANLRSADLRSADLSYTNLRYTDLSYTNLRYADLSYADLSYADLSYANLSYADLSYADLSYADLSYANLRPADLRYATGNMKTLKSIFLDTYPITYTAEVMQIGCQRHEISKWWGFSDEEITRMDGEGALDWWNKYKAIIRQIIELSPAEPTKREESK